MIIITTYLFACLNERNNDVIDWVLGYHTQGNLLQITCCIQQVAHNLLPRIDMLSISYLLVASYMKLVTIIHIGQFCCEQHVAKCMVSFITYDK